MAKKNTNAAIKQIKRFDADTEDVFVINVTNKEFADNFKNELVQYGLPEEHIIIESPDNAVKGDIYKMLIANASVNIQHVIDLMRSKGLSVNEIETLLGIELEEIPSPEHIIATESANTDKEEIENFVK